MKPFSIVLALAAISSAELIPQISEPRSVAATGLSLTAFGDSVYQSYYQHVALFARKGDQMVKVSERSSDTLDSEHPRLFHFGGDLPDLALGSTRIAPIDRSVSPWLLYPRLPGIQLGHRWVTGGAFDQPSTKHILACGEIRAYHLSTGLLADAPGMVWATPDTLDMPNGGRCDVDPKTGLAVMMTADSALSYSVRVSAASTVIRSAPMPLRAQRVDWVLMGWDNQWVAWDGLRHTAYGAVDFTPIDSQTLNLPVATYPSGAVARRDSLVAFGQNGTLVLAKWTQGTPMKFKIISSTTLSATKSISAVAIADSTLWATTGDTLYSFRLGWARASGVERSSALSRNAEIEVRTSGKVAAFTWGGGEPATLDIVDAQGRSAAQLRLDPGVASSWTAPRTGIWFARSGSGTRMFLAR